MLGLFLALFVMSPTEIPMAGGADSSLLPDIRIRPYGEAASPLSARGHLRQQPLVLYIDPPGGMTTWVSSRMETSLDGINFSPTPRSGSMKEQGEGWFSQGELSDATTCYRMRWKDRQGGEHISGVLLARRCHNGIVNAVCASPFTTGESIGLEISLRQRAFVRVVLTEQSTGHPQLLYRGMADGGLRQWDLGAGIEIRPGIWEMAVYVNGTECMRFEIEI